ncbi:ABC transporter substrate-binding protein [Mobilitalea sibirica]|uniref:ABC transporter substrate-binding protein n=1 Tax=Mobilitalea sibirica TaxID=1462919 RepID=A0A8J7H1D2_9FIRM|nr:ABC transporter substrate-binding protein [Mobilitalea sibirica]MBH1939915.1 ABC transporter substrate-binding protein [Mobilitalea sibirica]
MLRKRVSIIIIFVISMVLLYGCTKPNDDKELADKELKKDELILAVGSEPEDGFDPTTGWGRYGSPLFQSTLLARDEELKIVYDLATNYEISEDGLVWTVYLRKDARFSDGEPVTSEDVKYTYEMAANSGSVIDLNILDKVEALDEYTVEFTLKNPQSTFIHSLLTLGIVPKHFHSKNYAENPIGSGPFKLVQWDKGQQIIVEYNNEYYGEESFFKKITFLFLSEDAAFAAAKAGSVDLAYVPPTFAKQEIEGMKVVKINSIDNRGIAFPYVEAGGKNEKGYPVGNDVTSDLAIRKAINIAIDRQALVDGVLEGFGSPAYTICDGMPWWNPNSVIDDADMEGAKRLLSESGWKDSDDDGILEKGDVEAEFTLLYPASDQTRQYLAISVAEMIKPLGINIIVEGASWDNIEMMMHSNAVLLGWGSHDAMEMYNVYSGKAAGNGWYNTGFYQNARVDEYLEQALAATSEEEAIGYWKKSQWDGETGMSAHGDAPWAWLVNLDHIYMAKENLDMGTIKMQPHGHGWPITDNILKWHWSD